MSINVFSKQDERFMQLALDEARKALRSNEFPVGAVLSIDGLFSGSARNTNESTKAWNNHAEANLLAAFSPKLKVLSRQTQPAVVTLYTTLEPCLFCLGSSITNRVQRIVYAVPDPYGGATGIDFSSLPPWYTQRKPRIEHGLFEAESRTMLLAFLDTQTSDGWLRIREVYRRAEADTK